MKNIIWLASYPKSGNTWLRILLDSLLSHDGSTVNINELKATNSAFLSRRAFDEFLEFDSTNLTMSETAAYKRLFYLHFAKNLSHDFFLKTHEANVEVAEGEQLIPEEVTKHAIYMVRNPLDVVSSLANHLAIEVDAAIAIMEDHGYSLFRNKKGITASVDEWMGSWSDHVKSWMDSTYLPISIIKYEKLLAAPQSVLKDLTRELGMAISDQLIAKAVENNRFEVLSNQEKEMGFQEKKVTSKAFFRSGKSGGWKEELTPQQIHRISDCHGEMMKKLGYLVS